MRAVDTSVLVYAEIRNSRFHERARAVLTECAEGAAAWARRRRIFEVDPLTCPRCQGVMRVVAVITDAAPLVTTFQLNACAHCFIKACNSLVPNDCIDLASSAVTVSQPLMSSRLAYTQ